MMEGKVSAALRLLSDGDDAGALSLDETISENGPSVREILEEKTPRRTSIARGLPMPLLRRRNLWTFTLSFSTG